MEDIFTTFAGPDQGLYSTYYSTICYTVFKQGQVAHLDTKCPLLVTTFYYSVRHDSKMGPAKIPQ